MTSYLADMGDMIKVRLSQSSIMLTPHPPRFRLFVS